MSVYRLLFEKRSLLQPSPSLIAKERARWPQLSFHPGSLTRCWPLAGPSQTGAGLWEQPPWDVVVSEGVCVQAGMRAGKCVPAGLRNTAAPLAPGQRGNVSLTHARSWALCSPLPPRCFAKPLAQLTQQLSSLEARGWRSPIPPPPPHVEHTPPSRNVGAPAPDSASSRLPS